MGNGQSALDVLLPLRASGNQLPLFCVHPAGGLSWCYAGLMKSLGTDYPIYGVQARGIAKNEELPKSLEEMAADYLKHVREVQSTDHIVYSVGRSEEMLCMQWQRNYKMKGKK